MDRDGGEGWDGGVGGGAAAGFGGRDRAVAGAAGEEAATAGEGGGAGVRRVRVRAAGEAVLQDEGVRDVRDQRPVHVRGRLHVRPRRRGAPPLAHRVRRRLEEAFAVVVGGGASVAVAPTPPPAQVVHELLARGSGSGGGGHRAITKVCFEFRDKGICYFGETCAFPHVSAAGNARSRSP